MKKEHLIMALAFLLFFWYLGSHGLWAPDEPFFAEGAREMLVDGHWLVSHVNGVVNNHKPPMFFWLIAITSYPLGHITEWTARIPSALAALGVLWMTLRLGRPWYGPRTAMLAVGLLATANLFWDKARWCQIDALLCFLIWVALSAFEAYRAGDLKGRPAGILFWSMMALAVLSKGPVGLLLPLGIALLTLAFDRRMKQWRGFAPITGPLAFLAIAGAWVWAVSLWGPDNYSVLGSLREHFVNRGLHGMHHAQPFYYYLYQFPAALLPWSGLLPGALWLGWRQRAHPGSRMALVAVVFVVLFFSISTEKRVLYVLPAFPAVALLMARLVAVIAAWGEDAITAVKTTLSPKWVTLGHGLLNGLFALLGLVLVVKGRDYPEVPHAAILTVGILLLGMSVTTFVYFSKRRPVAGLLATIAGMYAVYLFAATAIYPSLDPVKSAEQFALTIKAATAESTAKGQQIMAWRAENVPTALAFYSNGLYSIEATSPSALEDFLAADHPVYAVVLAKDLNELDPATLANLWFLHKANLSRKDLFLITNKPRPDAKPLDLTEFKD